VNKRTTGKAWGVIFVCTSTSLAHVEVAESYSTESFLMAVKRFMALHGAPRRLQSKQMQNIFLINLKCVFVAEDCYFLFVRLQMCAVVLRKHRSRDRLEMSVAADISRGADILAYYDKSCRYNKPCQYGRDAAHIS
jgi:hypothetical protein